ncbi:MAG TPA: GvpL/GvpF family gas vesicle protein [Thermoanaerobaculia bacterium]|nr:GvpL/GvpF family gas vesicle protein [Thermoanaerobaculia bacterium]
MAVLYVYAITRDAVTPQCEAPCEAIDQSQHFAALPAEGICAVYTAVSEGEFSQEVIDRRASDLEWLGAVGYRHQNVIVELMKSTAVVPLRAFTMFSSESTLREYLVQNRDVLAKLLERLDGKHEWTLRVEFDPRRWSEALTGRVESLRALSAEIESANAGKAFLLRKKLDEERKRASREAEQQVVADIEREVIGKLACDTLSESRLERDGAFPQINVLIDRDEESRLQELHASLNDRYAEDGVTLAMTGPWPPYTFAHV